MDKPEITRKPLAGVACSGVRRRVHSAEYIEITGSGGEARRQAHRKNISFSVSKRGSG